MRPPVQRASRSGSRRLWGENSAKTVVDVVFCVYVCTVKPHFHCTYNHYTCFKHYVNAMLVVGSSPEAFKGRRTRSSSCAFPITCVCVCVCHYVCSWLSHAVGSLSGRSSRGSSAASSRVSSRRPSLPHLSDTEPSPTTSNRGSGGRAANKRYIYTCRNVARFSL